LKFQVFNQDVVPRLAYTELQEAKENAFHK